MGHKILYYLPITSIYYTLNAWNARVPNNPIDKFPIIHGLYCGLINFGLPFYILTKYIL